MRFNPNQNPNEQNQNTFSGGSPNPYDPYGTNVTVPGTPPNVYNPYEPSPTNPNPQTPWPATPPPPPTSPFTVPPTVTPSPPRQRSSLGRTLLILLAALVILAGIGLAVFVPYQNAQTEKANATATAQTHATNVARVATGTALATNATATVFANDTTATAQANASATASVLDATATVVAANPNPYPPKSGTLVLYDPLTDNNQGNNWTDSVDQSGSGCTFKGGAYHLISGKSFIQSCSISSYQDFAFQARMMILKGDCGSLVFREDSNSGYYAFSVCQDGSYSLDFYTNNGINLISSSSSAITSGLNQPNVIAVVAKGHQIDLYVNNHHLNGTNDNRSGSGSIGFAASAFNNTTEVAFNDAKLWKL